MTLCGKSKFYFATEKQLVAEIQLIHLIRSQFLWLKLTILFSDQKTIMRWKIINFGC